MAWPNDAMPVEERICLARSRTQAVVDHYIDLVRIHATVQKVFYTDVLSAQIPRSRAANAFNCFRESLFKIEIVRLCALWDKPSADRASIPSIFALLNQATTDVIVTGVYERELAKEDQNWATETAERAQKELSEARDTGVAIANSDLMVRLRAHRDKHLAHALTEETLADKPPPRYGDERKLFDNPSSTHFISG